MEECDDPTACILARLERIAELRRSSRKVSQENRLGKVLVWAGVEAGRRMWRVSLAAAADYGGARPGKELGSQVWFTQSIPGMTKERW